MPASILRPSCVNLTKRIESRLVNASLLMLGMAMNLTKRIESEEYVDGRRIQQYQNLTKRIESHVVRLLSLVQRVGISQRELKADDILLHPKPCYL